MPDDQDTPAGAGHTGRLSAAEIYERVVASGKEEVHRPPHNLLFSAVAAGLSMGLSGLAVATVLAVAGKGPVAEALAYLAYPLGFVAVIIGRQQLFTENTLFPVALVLRTRRHLGATARLWAVVAVGNILGTLAFAGLVVRTPAIPAPISAELATLGKELGGQGFGTTFWTAVVAGWLVALLAWLVTASTDTTAQVVVIVLITYVIGLAGLAHSIAGSGEVLAAVLAGRLPLTAYLTWIVAAVLGNVAGGVGIVALLNYGQVHRTP